MNNRDSTLIKTAVVWAVLALLGAVAIRWFTQNGLSLWEDSFDYITAAFSLAEGGGYGRLTGYGNFRPLTHFPPAYSAALAGFEIIGVGLYTGARYFNALLFAALIFGSGWLTYRLTRSPAWSIAAAGLVLVSETLIYAHLWALTEPLYLALTAITLLALGGYIARPERRAPLIGSAVFAALALLTRYAGAATVAAGAAALLLLAYRPLRRRLIDTVLFLGIAALPIALFILRNVALTGSPTDDPSPSWHPPLGDEWIDTLRVVLNWFLPDVVVEGMGRAAVLIVSIVGLVLLAALLMWVFRSWSALTQPQDPQAGFYLWIILFFILAYLLLYLVTVFWLRRITPADERLLTPIHWGLLLLLPSLLGLAWRRGPHLSQAILVLAFGALLAVQLLRARGLPGVYANEAFGFSSARWRNSQTIAAVETFPDVLLYSNEIQAIFFLDNRSAIYVPTPFNPATLVTRSDYPAALERMRANMREEGALLVLFHSGSLEESHFQDLTAGLEVGGQFHDGEWYYWPERKD